MYVLVDFYSRNFVGTPPQTMMSAACPSPNGQLGNGSMPRYFRGTFHSCMGTMPMFFTWQGLLVWTQQETTITLDNRGVLLAGVRHTMVTSMAHLQTLAARGLEEPCASFPDFCDNRQFHVIYCVSSRLCTLFRRISDSRFHVDS